MKFNTWKFKTVFFGASHLSGEIYARTYTVGEDCPEDLLEAAVEADAVDAKADKTAAKAEKKAKA